MMDFAKYAQVLAKIIEHNGKTRKIGAILQEHSRFSDNFP